MIRYLAALLVAVLLPIQGYAAACAQICAANGRSHADVAAVDHEAGGHCHEVPAQPPPEEDADESHVGLAKCCQAHVFAFDGVSAPAGQASGDFPETPYLARWSSFIPDEPSPPPIAFATA